MKPIKGPSQRRAGGSWWQTHLTWQGPKTASLETMRLGCYLETGRQRPADELGWRRAFQTGKGLSEAGRGSPGWLELRVRGRGLRASRSQGPDDAGPLATDVDLYPKSPGRPRRIFSKGTAHCLVNVTAAVQGKGWEEASERGASWSR